MTSASKQSRFDLIAACSLFFGFCLIAISYILSRPDLLIHQDYLFRDEGVVLSVIDQLLSGKKLYDDVFWHYGPLPIWYYFQWAKIFGNNAFTYLISLAPIFAAAATLSYGILRNHTTQRQSLFAALLVIFPIYLHMVSGGRIYVPFEMLGLLSLTFIYVKPSERSHSRAFLMGLILAAMQWNKFGGAVIVGGSLAMTDLILIYLERHSKKNTFLSWLNGNLFILLGFLALESLRASYCYLLLSDKSATTVFFPIFHLTGYTAYSGEQGFSFESWSFLFGKQIPIVLMLVVGILFFIYQAANSKLPDSFRKVPWGSLIPLIFYLLGLTFYFKHKWLAYQYLWVLVIPFVAVALQLTFRWRIVILSLILPSLAMFPYKWLIQASDREHVIMPNGSALWMDNVDSQMAKARFDAARAAIGTNGSIVFFGSGGGGFHHYGNIAAATRHRWFLPGFLQAQEIDQVFAQTLEADALIVKGQIVRQISEQPDTWHIDDWSPYSSERNQQLSSKLEAPIIVNNHWAIFKLKSNDSPPP